MEHIWKYGGREYECDILDCDKFAALAGSLEKLLAELGGIEYKAGEAVGKAEVAERLKRNCMIIESFFESVFGGEAAREICGGGANILDYTSALAAFFGYITSEIDLMKAAGERVKAEFCSRIGVGVGGSSEVGAGAGECSGGSDSVGLGESGCAESGGLSENVGGAESVGLGENVGAGEAVNGADCV